MTEEESIRIENDLSGSLRDTLWALACDVPMVASGKTWVLRGSSRIIADAGILFSLGLVHRLPSDEGVAVLSNMGSAFMKRYAARLDARSRQWTTRIIRELRDG